MPRARWRAYRSANPWATRIVRRITTLADKLDAGAQFPEMTLSRTSGGSFTLPRDFSGSYAIVLFYRGHW